MMVTKRITMATTLNPTSDDVQLQQLFGPRNSPGVRLFSTPHSPSSLPLSQVEHVPRKRPVHQRSQHYHVEHNQDKDKYE